MLFRFFESVEVERGAALFHEGDPGDELFFIEQGEVEAQLTIEDGETRRLRKSGPGTIVGEMALYTRQPRSADIVATERCIVLKLTAERLAELERTHPLVAIEFHSFLVTLLSSRLASSTEEVRALS